MDKDQNCSENFLDVIASTSSKTDRRATTELEDKCMDVGSPKIAVVIEPKWLIGRASDSIERQMFCVNFSEIRDVLKVKFKFSPATHGQVFQQNSLSNL